MELSFYSLIDMKLAVTLWLLGLGIKHLEWKPIKQLSNKLIPVLLIITGIGLSCVFHGDVTFDAILTGAITAIFAVGVHSSGKNVLKTLMGENNTVYVEGDGLAGGSNIDYSGEDIVIDNPDDIYNSSSDIGGSVG